MHGNGYVLKDEIHHYLKIFLIVRITLIISGVYMRIFEFFKRLLGGMSTMVHSSERIVSAVKNIAVIQRESVHGALYQAKKVGLHPGTVIDVGAAFGHFTSMCYEAFSDAHYLMIEPLEEYKPFLLAVEKRQTNTSVVFGASTATPGTITINVHPDLVGSSIFQENEESNVNGMPRQVLAVTIDQLIKERNFHGPYLIKVDVQGAEIEVMKGALETLADTDYVILEVSFFNFFQVGPEVFDVVNFMKDRGFVVYDIFGPMYRPLDNAMSQIDVAFVKEKSIFRKHHFYATPEQREVQNQQMETIRKQLCNNKF